MNAGQIALVYQTTTSDAWLQLAIALPAPAEKAELPSQAGT
jgi:hypothetical protein